MIQRAQREPLKLTDKAVQNRVMEISSRIINEFYEFEVSIRQLPWKISKIL